MVHGGYAAELFS